MKVRKGFVSNSSSSSFVAVIDRELYNKMYDDFPESYRLVADMIFEKKKGFVYGQILSGNIGEYFIEDLQGKKEYFRLAELLKDEESDISESEIRSMITEEVNNFEFEISSLLRAGDKETYIIDGTEM